MKKKQCKCLRLDGNIYVIKTWKIKIQHRSHNEFYNEIQLRNYVLII